MNEPHSLAWFYALMVVVCIGAMYLEVWLDNRTKRKRAEMRLRNR